MVLIVVLAILLDVMKHADTMMLNSMMPSDVEEDETREAGCTMAILCATRSMMVMLDQ